MAQDRIYIRCKACGQSRGLVGLSWACRTPDGLYAITDGLSEWLEEHARHNSLGDPGRGMMQFGPPSDWFILESETESLPNR